MVPSTAVRLCSNVPFSLNQTHVREFRSETEQRDYFYSMTRHILNNFTYQREERAIRVPISIEQLHDINYLMYRNVDYTHKWFYGFVTRKEYINPNTTALYFEIDVYQTWLFETELRESYVIREHVNRWNGSQPIVNTIPESLNYGSEYDTVSADHIQANLGYRWLVIVSKEVLHVSTDPKKIKGNVHGSLIGTHQPLSYYVIPFKDKDNVPTVRVGPGDSTGVGLTPPITFLSEIYKDTTAVNNIVSLYISENVGIDVDITAVSGGPDVMLMKNGAFEGATIGTGTAIHVLELPEFHTYTHVTTWDKYVGYREDEESKLLMYPYTVTVLDDLRGNRIEYKNEYITGDTIKVQCKGSLGISNKTSWHIDGYNYFGPSDLRDQLNNEFALINNDPSDVPIVNEFLASHIQGNRNQLNNQRSQILANATFGLMGGLMGGGVGGATLGLGASLTSAYFQIQGLNAQLEDIRNVPPSLAKMGSNVAYDIGNNYTGVFLIRKQIKQEYQQLLSDFFKLYGYKVNRLKIPMTRSRRSYNFIHTADVNLKGNVPHEHKQLIKDIYNSGVTVWHTNDIGNYSLDNTEVVS